MFNIHMIMKHDLNTAPAQESPDVVLIGAGIMSATLGVVLKQLRPELTIQIVEGLPAVAQESSNVWNNAGTGHAALCELNYTPETSDGTIDISRALKINAQFETSKHFWGFLVEHGHVSDPSAFVRACPHMSFVWGKENQSFLKRRHAAMSEHHLFEAMQYTADPKLIEEWAPLLTAGRPSDEALAATRAEGGTDVNYGSLTRKLINYLVSLDGVDLALETQVTDLVRDASGGWRVALGRKGHIVSDFVFIGGGGGALPLLQKAGIPEGRGFGGFPVSGQFLLCKNKGIVERHGAKVYGKAAVGAPPMSVPHLDTRIIEGHKSLLFGPYAGFSPKYLKTGSNFDLLKSVKPDNVLPMLAAGRDNMSLTQYLVNECRKSHGDRCDMLREFFPDAKDEDWRLITAGQRVQMIKKDSERTGKLQFGTEVVTSSDGSLSTVLGASPGASTAVSILLQLLEQSFPKEMKSDAWASRLSEMIPGYGIRLSEDKDAHAALGSKAEALLGLV